MIQFFNNVTEQYKDKLRTPFFGTFIFWWFVFHVEAIYDLLFIQKLTKNVFVKAKSICVDNSICNTNFNELNNTQKELLLIDYKRLLFNSLFEFSLSNLLRIIFLTLLSLFLFYVFKAITYSIISKYNNDIRPRILELTKGKVVEEYRFRNLQNEFDKIEKENNELKSNNLLHKNEKTDFESKNNDLLREKSELNIKIKELNDNIYELTNANLTELNFKFFLFLKKYFRLEFDYYLENKSFEKISNNKFSDLERFLRKFKQEIPKYKRNTKDTVKEWVFELDNSNFSEIIKEMDIFLDNQEGQIIFKNKQEFENIYKSLKGFILERNPDDLPF
jgi:hypothetical protein